MKDYGSEIRRKREAKGLTQQNVADLMCWSLAKVSKVENNHQILPVDEYDKLMEFLDGTEVVIRTEIEWPTNRYVSV